jgi:hypothetical protein
MLRRARLLHTRVCCTLPSVERVAMAKCPAFEQCSGYMGSWPLRVHLCLLYTMSCQLHLHCFV